MPRRSSKRIREPQAKLKYILGHAARVFSEKGFEGASIRDISRASRVSLAGLYYYFESKQKLLYLIQLNAFTSILDRLQERLKSAQKPEERLRLLISNHIEYFLRNPIEMKVMAHEEDALEDPYRKEVLEIKRRYYEIARSIFDDLRRDGQVGRINPRVAVLSLFGMMNWVYKWHNPKVDPQADVLGDTIAGIFLHGVCNGKSANGARAEALRDRLAEQRIRASG